MKAQIWTDSEGKMWWVNPKRIHEYVNCKIEYRDVSPEEIVKLWIPEAMVTVKIPIQVFLWSQEMQEKIRTLDLLYNGLDRRTMDGYLHIENIDTHDVPEYLSMDEYQRMKNAWVIFPPEIISIFENTESEQPENQSENPIDTVSENENLESGEPWVENTQVEE